MPNRTHTRRTRTEAQAPTASESHRAGTGATTARTSIGVLSSPRLHAIAVPILLAIPAALAIASLIGDSVTFDETSHLACGMSYLKTGDFRMGADHPPLAKIWAALPLLLVDQRWPSSDDPSWRKCAPFGLGKQWLCRLNDPDRLIIPARLMMVVLLLATCLTVYALARTLFGLPAALLLYPLLFALAGAAATWLTTPRAHWAIGGALAWLVGATLWIHPHYLSYFNELIGGPAKGHKYLLDSNIDWGQDLKRLARYTQQHADQPLQLAYFGSAEPTAYGIHCVALPGFFAIDALPAKLTGGLYVLSVTQLFAVNEPAARDEFWNAPGNAAGYREPAAAASAPPPSSPQPLEKWRAARAHFEDACRYRLMNQLQHRRPDDRIGYSLFAYKLSQAQVDDLIRPWSGRHVPRPQQGAPDRAPRSSKHLDLPLSRSPDVPCLTRGGLPCRTPRTKTDASSG